MGRSKFPGKPSKHVNRTRVNVLAATNAVPLVNNTTTTVAIAATSTTTTTTTTTSANGNASDTASDNNPNVVAVDEDDERPERDDPQADVCPENGDDGADDDDDYGKSCENQVRETRAQVSRKKKKRVSIKRSPIKRTRLIPANSPLTRSRVTRRSAHGGLNHHKPPSRSPKKERKDNLVGKFVLPIRSVHSSRVIKPNKRFINIEQETRIIRKRVKRQCNLSVVENVVADDKHKEKDKEKEKQEEEETNAESIITSNVLNEQQTTTTNTNKVVLRQARLQLSTKTQLSSTEGPFSTFSTNTGTSTSPPRTITCGVCGAVRFYRFVKHARKFNIFSCESCRKFISKQIKRTTTKSTASDATLNCLKGQGLCHVPPNVRSQQWKVGTHYNSRCPACWLKLCLRSFQIPMALKSSLTQQLPKYMQPSETSSLFASSLNSLPLLTWQAATDQSVIVTTNKEQSARTSSPSVNSPSQQQAASNSNGLTLGAATATNEQTLRQRSVRLKHGATKNEKVTVSPQVDIKRAKVDLKGPRVKHVCRSASIVLGQLPATFPVNVGVAKILEENKVDEKDVRLIEINDKIMERMKDDKIETKCKVSVVKEETLPKVQIVSTKVQEAAIEIAVSTCDQSQETIQIENHSMLPDANVPPTLVKKEKPKMVNALSMLPMEIIKPSFNKKCKNISTQLENPNMLNIDFWETYDPDEIVCNGYSIIASEAFPMRAICFLCGSAGKETLVHCCICCEPYHPYCLEQGPPNFEQSNEKFSWICPKCTTCSACGEADKQKINCQKCHKAYHPQCFNHKWRTDDRPTVCSNCLRCKSCGTDNITKFVGNLALCLACFKLRNKGNFCPLCQCCYDDNDFDTKMMECGKCNKWVHAKCEGLSDEQYQILSILPESVEFICCFCSTEPTAHWRKAIQQELRSCLNNILRLMSKNRIAREMLKLSPLKMCSPQINKLQSARRLQFVDTTSGTNDAVNSIDNELEHVNAIFKNKIDFGDQSSFNCSSGSMETNLLNESKLPISPRMLEIKNKLNCNEYFSLREFNDGMEHALSATPDGKLLEIYRGILKNVLPWFDPSVKEELNKTLDTSRVEVECEVAAVKNDEDEKKFDFHQSVNSSDTRVCNLCKGIGDGLPEKEARLLYCGQNEWVHSNCALWSSEVYEEIDGSLQNVHSAMSRGRSIRCTHCKQKGASVGCCLKGCHETYHFPCAQTADCHFIADRTMYCHSHEIPSNLNLITNCRDFAIRRSVYIEVDTKKKRLCDRERVNYMVGSLSVVSLGKVIPSVSDSIDAIIPVGFVCSRLFWSTTEPWKLIPYKITTSIFNSQSEVYVDKNFTVDHSLPRHIVERKLKEIILWQKDDKEKSDIYEFEDYEEPQNAGDILSPELTDAILEELPHDLLEGLSMQDMLKEYEELMNMEFKNSEINCNDAISLNMNSGDKDEAVGDPRELKRSKSEVFQKIEDKKDKLKPRNQQRSCSLAWLQLDNTLSPAMKKRKITTPAYMQIVQVDGACDSSGSECGSPTHETEDLWAPDVDVKCEKCHCTYRTKISYERHLETCDAMFTSESETEDVANTTTEEQQSQVIYESFSYQTTQQNQIQATVMNTQTILESKTQLQDAGIIYNYQTVKPGMVTHSAPSTANMVDGSILNAAQFCQLNAPTNQCMIPVDNTHTQVINQMNPMNQTALMDPVTLQSVPYTHQDCTPFLNLSQQNQAITIDAKVLAPVLNLQQNQWVRPMIPQKPRPRPRQTVTKQRPHLQQQQQRMVQVLPQNSQSVILQHIPTSNMLPFVDASSFQQQGLQYVMAPHVPQVNTSTAQLVQLPENNFLSLVQNVPHHQVQPTMIIQQPRVDHGQIIVDSNGSMLWAQPIQQVQPVYYGIETVQTTVMQSQQFMPTTMPGMLTTNSSYSATTQVFQTSKLEPVLDGGYVLVNQNQLLNQNQLVNNAVQVPQMRTSCANVQSMQMKPPQMQSTPTSIATSLAIQAPPSLPPPPQPPQQSIAVPVTTTWNTIEQPHQPIHFNQTVATPIVSTHHPTTNSIPSNATNSITLPVAPFVSEQGIPTNIVTPTPKPAPPQPPLRPMSRVLPMQTSTTQKKQTPPIPPMVEKTVTCTDNKFTIICDIVIKQKTPSPLVSPTITRDVLPTRDFKIEVTKDIQGIGMKDVPIVMARVEKVEPIKKEPVKEIKEIKELNKKLHAEKVTEKLFTINIETSDALVKDKKESKDKEPVLKVNKIPVAPLKPNKPKASALSNATNANKENICENVQEPKYSKRPPNTTSIYFKIESADGFDYTAPSLPQIWRKVFTEVQAARTEQNLPPLPDVALRAINDLDILGLKTKGMRFLIEQLPDAVKCKQYKPFYHKPKDPYQFEDDDDEDGARRCIPYDNKREKYDMFGWLSSKNRTLEMYDLDAILKKNASSSLPMAMRFRALRVISKYTVGVYRSDIHGRGLFSLRDIESGEMVIEYAGEVIRSVLTDKREKHYNTKGIGCYMFRIDDNLVVDATMKGNAARFINHSCDPNCYSKVVEILGNKHIIIFALRKIICGEELTYDYKFPFEEDKIPCSCGTKRCRKFLN